MLKVYNTLTKKKEEFKPLHEGAVTIYVCGPTVYSFSHIGHAKTYIHFDIIIRYLRYLGYKVKYVQNITDVGHLEYDRDEGEDKIVKQAKKEHVDPMELVEIYMRENFKDMDSLNVFRPNISPRASGHIPEIIEFIEVLIKKGFAYDVDGSVYFNVEKFPQYGRLSGRKLEEIKTGTRVKAKIEKKHPADFALWKKADQSHILQWSSPWSRGYPGWHIECSVMSMKYLGSSIDFHGGAVEISFPHHENEIAQSEVYSGEQFVRYWLHGGLVTVEGQKMSKSLGNFITIKSILEKFDAEVVRFFIASRHYRQPIDFTEELVYNSKEVFSRVQRTIQRLILQKNQVESSGEVRPFIKIMREKYSLQFKKAMDDDFNTPVAIALLLEMTKEVNRLLELNKITLREIGEVLECYEEFGKVLGVFVNISKDISLGDMGGINYLSGEIAILLGKREEARQNKEWRKADEIRQMLFQKGWALEDVKEGVRWEKNKKERNKKKGEYYEQQTVKK